MKTAMLGAAVLAVMAMMSGALHAAEPCEALLRQRLPDTEIASAVAVEPAKDAASGAALPAHCLVRGTVHKRVGVNGVPFGDQFELRLPVQWNERFYFQGGGGTDGSVRPAIGSGQPFGTTPALAQGYAVVSTDGGHEDEDSSFGLDAEARTDWGYQVIPRVTGAAKALIRAHYGRAARFSYLVGCSNGGRQAMVASQRFPALFDGLVAGDPVFRMSTSHIDSAWGLQKLTAIAPKDPAGAPILSRAFSAADLKLVADDILRQCDAKDGLADGLILRPSACRYSPAGLACRGEKTESCLAAPQVEALAALYGGSKDGRGRALYSTWPWDPGIGSPGWRAWKLGTSTTAVPNAIKAGLSNNAIKHVFLTPPDPGFDTLRFDFDRDPARMKAAAAFADATSTALGPFAARGGKIIFYHGMSDPAISADDTVRYFDALRRDRPRAASFARLFLVPGMTHCSGGSGLETFDPLAAIRRWVEEKAAPERLLATGRAVPGVERPLCAYPREAVYDGRGDARVAGSFVCRASQP